jgi:hypothetical protein
MSETMRRVIISAAVILLVICLCLSLFLVSLAGALALDWL